MERIVVGFDGSEQSHKALERAADIANGATLAVVCAANVARYLRDPAGGVAPVDPAERRRGRTRWRRRAGLSRAVGSRGCSSKGTATPRT